MSCTWWKKESRISFNGLTQEMCPIWLPEWNEKWVANLIKTICLLWRWQEKQLTTYTKASWLQCSHNRKPNRAPKRNQHSLWNSGWGEVGSCFYKNFLEHCAIHGWERLGDTEFYYSERKPTSIALFRWPLSAFASFSKKKCLTERGDGAIWLPMVWTLKPTRLCLSG